MKQRPILFQTAMVLALLAGTKTQTRRIIKPQPDTSDGRPLEIWYGWPGLARSGTEYHNITPPYGRPGDVLWVRETFYAFGIWLKNGISNTGKQKYKFVDLTNSRGFGYLHCDNPPDTVKQGKRSGEGWYKRPSLFMPYDACRLFLQIKSVRVERVQHINEADANAEGIESWFVPDGKPQSTTKVYRNYLANDYVNSPQASYQSLWLKINGPESWCSNPFVWVVEFERIDKPSV